MVEEEKSEVVKDVPGNLFEEKVEAGGEEWKDGFAMSF